jgi:membrane protein DedA with SNARE-associated domain
MACLGGGAAQRPAERRALACLGGAAAQGPAGGRLISLSDLGDQLLSGMLTYGYPILGITLLVGAIGVPVPASLVATVAGALLAEGDLQPLPTLLVALIACVAGDLVGYSIGRAGGDQFARRHGHWLGIGSKRIAQVQALYQRWAGPTMLVSRSLIAILAPAVNLLAGASDESVQEFVAYSTVGRLLWIAIFVGLGYQFAGSAEVAADFASSLSGLLGLLVLTFFLAVVMRRRA